jgi:hypothetical protein
MLVVFCRKPKVSGASVRRLRWIDSARLASTCKQRPEFRGSVPTNSKWFPRPRDMRQHTIGSVKEVP